MTDQTLRTVELTRLGLGEYEATNASGAKLRFGAGEGDSFSPVELLLTAIAGCTAADVDYITVKRAEPLRFQVRMSGDKIRDESGNRMTNLTLELDVEFPDDEAGAAAREVLPRALAQSHDRLCTVSRTVEHGSPVTARLVGGS